MTIERVKPENVFNRSMPLKEGNISFDLETEDCLTPFELFFIGENPPGMVDRMNKAQQNGNHALKTLLRPTIFNNNMDMFARNADKRKEALKHVNALRKPAPRINHLLVGYLIIFDLNTFKPLFRDNVRTSLELSDIKKDYTSYPRWNIRLVDSEKGIIDGDSPLYNKLIVNRRYTRFFSVEKSTGGTYRILHFKTNPA